jgi:hypothetical protein
LIFPACKPVRVIIDCKAQAAKVKAIRLPAPKVV